MNVHNEAGVLEDLAEVGAAEEALLDLGAGMLATAAVNAVARSADVIPGGIAFATATPMSIAEGGALAGGGAGNAVTSILVQSRKFNGPFEVSKYSGFVPM